VNIESLPIEPIVNILSYSSLSAITVLDTVEYIWLRCNKFHFRCILIPVIIIYYFVFCDIY